MEVLYLQSQGLQHQEIFRLSGIRSRTTLTKYFRQYEAGGVEGLKNCITKVNRVNLMSISPV
jgi:hypothetical protein